MYVRSTYFDCTVKLRLTTTSKRQPSAQDDCFRSVPIFLVRDTGIKQCVKDNKFSSVTATTLQYEPKVTKILPKPTESFKKIHAACIATPANIIFVHVIKFIYN